MLQYHKTSIISHRMEKKECQIKNHTFSKHHKIFKFVLQWGFDCGTIILIISYYRGMMVFWI